MPKITFGNAAEARQDGAAYKIRTLSKLLHAYVEIPDFGNT